MEYLDQEVLKAILLKTCRTAEQNENATAVELVKEIEGELEKYVNTAEKAV
ncbi:hypothetical protein [Alteribacter natronophilus]|uniref:hypothetical protein n=1 Tax=Alteribacter natronophilus TaxID=2583810 RepID=UPI0014862DBF|nr:hypothetical protein [Alteribacter natronophilus]